MFKFGRKFYMGLFGTVAIAAVGYVGGQIPAVAPLVPWLVGTIAGLTGLTSMSIAYEDSKHAQARADVEISKEMSQYPPNMDKDIYTSL